MSEQQMLEFCSTQRLPKEFQQVVDEFYLPFSASLPRHRPESGPLLLGINGAQGTGKSTLAAFLDLACSTMHQWNVAVLSIDDFYLTRDQRAALANDIHPLFMARGVPGTHDVGMLERCLDTLRGLRGSQETRLPRFDKAVDDRADESDWPVVTGPVDLIILEGWCVGSESQPENELIEPVNDLESNEDKTGAWRRYANEQLRSRYRPVFDQLDLLVFLEAPNFDAILRWRLEQEQKLAALTSGSGLMTEDEIGDFIQFYERLTRANLATLPGKADVVFHLDEAHGISRRTDQSDPKKS